MGGWMPGDDPDILVERDCARRHNRIVTKDYVDITDHRRTVAGLKDENQQRLRGLDLAIRHGLTPVKEAILSGKSCEEIWEIFAREVPPQKAAEILEEANDKRWAAFYRKSRAGA